MIQVLTHVSGAGAQLGRTSEHFFVEDSMPFRLLQLFIVNPKPVYSSLEICLQR